MSTDDTSTAGDNPGGSPPEEPYSERFRLQGKAMVAKVKELLHEGNVQRITVKDSDGHTVMEVPVTAGVVVTIVAPVLVAVAALAALASEWEIEIHRTGPPA